MKTLPDLLNKAVEGNLDKVAISEPTRNLTYLELRDAVHFLTQKLSKLGVKKGQTVALLMPNSAEFVASFYAIVTLGAIAVPLNPHYQQNELTQLLSDSRASVLVLFSEYLERCSQALEKLPGKCELFVIESDVSWKPTASGKGPGRIGPVEPEIHPNDCATLQYSSGSTGPPKRIARSHSNLTFEIASLARGLGLKSEDNFVGVAPFSHVNGLVRSMLASLSVGATLFPLREFRRQELVRTIEEKGITIFIGVPFMFCTLADTQFNHPVNFSSLRLCISASAPMPLAENTKFQEKYGPFVRQLYGSTETGTISVNMGNHIATSLESVGLPIDGVTVTVYRDDGAPAKPNEVGELAVLSPSAITAYQGSFDGNEDFREGQWFSGDLGWADERGYIYLAGRRKFFINKGGYKINPWEIESLISDHAKVKEVAVVGVPTRFGDESVKAVIIPRTTCTETEIVEHCRGKIADFKIPSLIEFRQELPRTPNGKVLRSELS